MASGFPLRETDVAEAGSTLTVNQFFPYRAWIAYLEAPRTGDHLATTPEPFFWAPVAFKIGVASWVLLSQGIGGTRAAVV